jgi:hypothetical protein
MLPHTLKNIHLLASEISNKLQVHMTYTWCSQVYNVTDMAG